MIQIPLPVAVAIAAFLIIAAFALLFYTTAIFREYLKAVKWKIAVIDALVVNWHYQKEHEENPQKAIADLVTAEIEMALDPLISSRAQALIDRGKQSANEPPPPDPGEFELDL